MEELTSSYWNILESPVIDKSTKSFQYNEFKEDHISNLVESNIYEITIKNSTWKLLSHAYLHVKSKIDGQGTNIVTVSNNGMNDFSQAILYYEGKEIERVDQLGVTTMIGNLVDFSGDISDTVASQIGWYLDTCDDVGVEEFTFTEGTKKVTRNEKFNKGFYNRRNLTKDGKTLEKFIPLSRIFRFCRDVNKILRGEIQIRLFKNTDKNILHSNNIGSYEYKITYLSLWIPEVEPSLKIQEHLDKVLASSTSVKYGWNLVNGYRSAVQISSDGSWRVVTLSNKITGLYVVFSRVSRQEKLKKSCMIFDHMNLQSIHTRVNNKQYPQNQFETNFNPDTPNYMRLYTSFLEAGFKHPDEGTCVSYKDFASLYPIVYFNLTKQEEEINNQSTTEIIINWKLREEPNEHYYVFCVVESEKYMDLNIIDKNIFLN